MTTIVIPEVRRIPHPDISGVAVDVWFDTLPEHPAVCVDIDKWGQELHIPASIAREVAAAILASVPE